MQSERHNLLDEKIVIRMQGKTAENAEELLSSDLFFEILTQFVSTLKRQQSRLLRIFPDSEITEDDLRLLTSIFRYLAKLPADLVLRVQDGSQPFFDDRELLNDFVEQLYNYWRSLNRVVVCDSAGDRLDKKPYRAFNETVEKLTHVVRSTYRDVQENITGRHPRIYRQVSAGAEIGAIALPRDVPFKADIYKKLNSIGIIRQVLIYPPLIFSSPMNKRTGSFVRVDANPVLDVELDHDDWLCYPAKVGDLVVLVYFSLAQFELGFSLCNLFELASDEDLKRQPDAIYLFGVEPQVPEEQAVPDRETIFFDDEANGILVGSIPLRDRYSYFGYLKKMILTLHNIIMMKRGRLPYHGAMVNLTLKGGQPSTVLIIGDTGAGKSETLEALRAIAGDEVEDLVVIADDMGSLALEDGRVIGYGTEMGAFVRLDDLQSGYAWGQIDRTIIMNPDQTNARVVIPVTKYDDVVRGFGVDYIFYANNYDTVDGDVSAVQSFDRVEDALEVFRAGRVMSKGTTTTTGLVQTYFANIFGPPQYQHLHDPLAEKFFHAFFDQNLFVGQLRTQLGVSGKEQGGPQHAARELLRVIRSGR